MPPRLKTLALDAGERAARAAASAALGSIGTTALVQSVRWDIVAGTAGVAAIVSLLLSVAGSRSGDAASASFFSPPVHEVEQP